MGPWKKYTVIANSSSSSNFVAKTDGTMTALSVEWIRDIYTIVNITNCTLLIATVPRCKILKWTKHVVHFKILHLGTVAISSVQFVVLTVVYISLISHN